MPLDTTSGITRYITPAVSGTQSGKDPHGDVTPGLLGPAAMGKRSFWTGFQCVNETCNDTQKERNS